MQGKRHVTLVYVCPFKTYNVYPPLGLAYLASSLRVNQYPVTVVDTTFQPEDAVNESIAQHGSALVGFLILQTNYARSMALAGNVRARFPEIPIALGGPFPTTCPEPMFEHHAVHWVFRGEGEKAILEIMDLVNGARDASSIEGLCYRQDGQVVIRPPRIPIADMDTIPFPAYDLLPMESYLKIPMDMPMASPATTLSVTRGCYGNCIYCQPISRNLFGARVKRFSPPRVIEQLQWLIQQYKIRSICLADDEPFWKGEEWWFDLADLLKQHRIKLDFSLNSRVDTVDEALLAALKKVGLKYLSFGVESGSDTILKNLRKGYRAEKIVPAFDLCRKLGIVSRANVMIGSPGETWDTIQETLDMLARARPDVISMSVTTPIPGTDLYEAWKDRMSANGMDAGQLDRKHVVSIAEGLSDQDLRLAINKVFRQFMRMLVADLCNPLRKWPLKKMMLAREISLFRIHPLLPVRDVAFHLGYTRKSFA